jgi:hypothetical protein
MSRKFKSTARPGSKYFKGRAILGERVLRSVVWDGVRDYQNAPPLQALAIAEKMRGVQLHLQVDEDAVEDIEVLIRAPLVDPQVGGLVVWTRDHRTYRLIVQRLTKPPQAWLT